MQTRIGGEAQLAGRQLLFLLLRKRTAAGQGQQQAGQQGGVQGVSHGVPIMGPGPSRIIPRMPVSDLRFLAIDSSTDTLSVALGSGAPRETPLAFTGPGAAQASATLLPAVQSLLAQAGWSLASLDAIVFGRGPGSFTGLRTACSVAQGLAYGAGGRPVLPVDTLLALAESARLQRIADGQAVPASIAALLDARMDEMYVALYACGPEGLRTGPLQAPRLCAPQDLGGWLRASGAGRTGATCCWPATCSRCTATGSTFRRLRSSRRCPRPRPCCRWRRR